MLTLYSITQTRPINATDASWAVFCAAFETMRLAGLHCGDIEEANPGMIGGWGELGGPPANPLQAAERAHDRAMEDYTSAAAAVCESAMATPLDVARKLHATSLSLQRPEATEAVAHQIIAIVESRAGPIDPSQKGE